MRTVWLAVVFVMLSECFSRGLAASPARVLTVEDCVGLALRSDDTLKAAELNASASQAEAESTKKRDLPTFKIKGGYELYDQANIITVPQNAVAPGIPSQNDVISEENANQAHVSLEVGKRFFANDVRHLAAKEEYLTEAARLNAQRRKKVVAFEVRQAYFRALEDQLNVDILERIAEAKGERVRVLKAQEQAGGAAPEEVMNAESDLAASTLAIHKAENERETALVRLKQIISYPEETDIAIAPLPVRSILTASLSEATDTTLKNREELQIDDLRRQEADEDVNLAKSESDPDVSVTGSYTLQNQTGVTRPQVWYFGAHVDWSPFDWGKTALKVQSREQLMQKIIHENNENRKAVTLEVEEAWRAAKLSGEETEVQEKAAKAAEYGFRKTMERFSQGEIRTSSLLDAWAHFIKAYGSYVISIHELQISLARLEMSASAAVEKWTHPEEIYRPNLERLLNELKAVLPARPASSQ